MPYAKYWPEVSPGILININMEEMPSGMAILLIQMRYRPCGCGLTLSTMRPQMGSLMASQMRATMNRIMTLAMLMPSTSV